MAVLGTFRLLSSPFRSKGKYGTVDEQFSGFVLVGIPIYYMTQRSGSTDTPLIVGEYRRNQQICRNIAQFIFSASFRSHPQRYLRTASPDYVADQRLGQAGKLWLPTETNKWRWPSNTPDEIRYPIPGTRAHYYG
ncbi:hypothetical protein PHLCEN_2v10089 [Hermanssonia centrifuga]|uniref:Uncharacterized protein n=1 Tax=Hermanssonia centrifuga TaxID=98765 RepID=A0A2R6NNY0_9APHY|nr:hypothetical protein PHLCEN_2v10089 [Hermanssonia centrifuga]